MSLDYEHANKILSKSSNILWLGDCQAAEDVDFLQKNSIKTVITAAVGIQLKYPQTIQHHTYLLQDIKTENMLQYFDEIVGKIDKGLRNGGVLVHCGAGVSRSATIVIAFLIKFYKMNFLDALRFTKAKRPQICPNLGFQLQLKKYASINNNSETQTFQKPKPVSLKTQLKPRQQSKGQSSLSYGQLSSLLVAGKNPNQQLIRSRLTQPKGWRISYSIKPQIASSSLDPKTETEFYIKKMAKFRFGQTNTSKWGLY